MRNYILLATACTLGACADTGAQSVGSTATPTPSGGGSTPTPTPTDAYSQFMNPVDAKTYTAIGGEQVYSYSTDERLLPSHTQQAQIYAGNASTVRDSAITVAYDPRDAIFTLTLSDPKTGAGASTRFQDPGSRTNFGGAVEPQWGTPNLNALTGAAAAYNNPNIQYLQAGDGNPLSPYDRSGTGALTYGTNAAPPIGEPGSTYSSTTLFYEKPGSTTKYVTFAGYVRNSVGYNTATFGTVDVLQDSWHLERGAFAYGALTAGSAIPSTGTGTYNGEMLATMVYNPTIDGLNGTILPTYFQWLTGTSKVTVDFGAKSVSLDLAGVVLNPQIDRYTAPNSSFLAAGTTFTGHGSALIDIAATGGYKGSFVGGNFTFLKGATSLPVAVAGSSIDGAFFGPKAEETGGGFRVVGGIPDQRIDILGAFTAKK
ncbi:MAG: transferrin-binding protein-like solute binding protein [Sphingomonas sp.]